MKKIVIACLFLCVFWGNSIAGFHWLLRSFPGDERTAEAAFILITPVNREAVYGNTVTFRWEDGLASDRTQKISHYIVKIWDHRVSYMEEVRARSEEEGSNVYAVKLCDFRQRIKKRGTYLWKVTAIDSLGGYRVTEYGVFEVKDPRHDDEENPLQIAPYEIQFRYNDRLGTQQYNQFLQTIDPRAHMMSYSDVGFIFHQRNILGSPLELQEKFFLSSNVGVGAGFSTCFCLMNTLYFGLYPKVSMETSWFSTGLKSYTSNMMDVRAGMLLTFLPGGYLSLHAEYIPSYRIRYSQESGDLRTFQGKGWSWGIRWVIPERILPAFTLLGMKIDFRRIALRFDFARIKDSYTGTKMKIRGLGISYMLR